MDVLSLVMFAIVFVTGFVMFILGCSELRSGALNWKHDAVSPAMGVVYFFISTLVFLVVALWWTGMATDAALGTLGMFWYGLAWTSAVMAVACVCLVFVSTVGNKQNDDDQKLSIQEESYR